MSQAPATACLPGGSPAFHSTTIAPGAKGVPSSIQCLPNKEYQRLTGPARREYHIADLKNALRTLVTDSNDRHRTVGVSERVSLSHDYRPDLPYHPCAGRNGDRRGHYICSGVKVYNFASSKLEKTNFSSEEILMRNRGLAFSSTFLIAFVSSVTPSPLAP